MGVTLFSDPYMQQKRLINSPMRIVCYTKKLFYTHSRTSKGSCGCHQNFFRKVQKIGLVLKKPVIFDTTLKNSI